MSKKEDAPKTKYPFRVIIALMMEEASTHVISALVKEGFTVGPLGSNGGVTLTEELNMATLLTLRLEKPLTEKEAKNSEEARVLFNTEIKNVLRRTMTKYYMMWIGDEIGMCNWAIGNLKRDPPPLPPTDEGPYRTSAK